MLLGEGERTCPDYPCDYATTETALEGDRVSDLWHGLFLFLGLRIALNQKNGEITDIKNECSSVD